MNDLLKMLDRGDAQLTIAGWLLCDHLNPWPVRWLELD